MVNGQVVIPCYNEFNNLGKLFEECCQVVELSKGRIGFIIVDNGSTDQTPIFAESHQYTNSEIKFIRVSLNQGYGGGIHVGLNESTAGIIGWTHADLQTPLIDCLYGLELFGQGHSFIKGKRKGRLFFDRIFSNGMGLFESLLFRTTLVEINAQPTLFSRDLYEQWGEVPTDFSLDLYAYLLAKRLGYSIKRFDVTFKKRQHGISSWNTTWKSKFRFIRRTIRYSFELKAGLGVVNRSS